ncbi:oxidoreductase [Actinokineospora sp. G85]|uniref:oxidoreductase n=1 Tax=Actinokineospora sp. G85 TaxID=3406626 RepID=UPI003C75BCE3
MGWSEDDIPDQGGRTALVTGANSGLGLRTAQVLAAKGARVLLGVRSPERGAAALAAIDGDAELVHLDLADLASVRSAAAEVRERTGDQLDLLVNNAGLMSPPRGSTADGFELQIGTNHLGHAALTWLLLPAVRDRVVTVSSLAHNNRGFDLDDLGWERRPYRAYAAYAASKTANLLFAFELHRRLAAAGSPVLSVAAHPGMTDTDLAVAAVRARVGRGAVGRAVLAATRAGNKLVTQSLERGTLPQLMAATAAGVRGGEYFGPTGPREFYGAPGRVKPRALAANPDIARTLWVRTAELTGVSPDPA